MICQDCAAGADLATQPAPQIDATRHLALAMHGRCKGCTCQHRVPDAETLRKRREAMPRGGLGRIIDLLS